MTTKSINQLTERALMLAHLGRGGKYMFLAARSSKEEDQPSQEQIADEQVGYEEEYTKSASMWYPTSLGGRIVVPMAWIERKDNIYFSLNPSDIRKPSPKRAKLEDVSAINCFFAEFDGKDWKREGQSIEDGKANILDHLDTLNRIDRLPYPTIVVDSGGGYHCYSMLENPVIITDENREQVRQVQYAWAKLYNADLGAKALTVAPRLPGTKNNKQKYAPNQPTVQVIESDWRRLFKYEEIERDTQPIWEEEARKSLAYAELMQERARENARNPNPDRDRKYVERAIDEECRKLASLSDGRRMATYYTALKVGSLVGTGAVTVAEAEEQLRSAAESNGTNSSYARDAIRNGLKRGMEKPRVIPPPKKREERYEHQEAQAENSDLLEDDGIVAAESASLTFARQLVEQGKTHVIDLSQEERRVGEALANEYVRPKIVIKEQLWEAGAEAYDAIVRWNEFHGSDPILYRGSGTLVQIAYDDRHKIRPMTRDAMRTLLSRVAQWYRQGSVKDEDEEGEEEKEEKKAKKKKGKEHGIFVPQSVAAHILSLTEHNELPKLDVISAAPSFDRNGKLCANAGYNPGTRQYYTNGVEIGDTTPTPERVAWAKSMLLDELLVDFKFAPEDGGTQGSLSNALALILLPYVMPMIDGQCPLHLISAPTAGIGKSLLADLCGIIATGKTISTFTHREDQEAFGKAMLAELILGSMFVMIDNVPKKLEGNALSTMLTQEFYKDRILGSTTTVEVTTKRVWIATGINTIASNETARRFAYIRLDSDEERPQDRTGFKHPEVKVWARENRADLLTACLIIVHAWVDKGMPKGKVRRTKGSFQSWIETMNGILSNIGIYDICANDHVLSDEAEDSTEGWKEFVEEWWNTHQDNLVTCSEIFKIAGEPGEKDIIAPGEIGAYKGLLSGELRGNNTRARQTSLGNLLKSRKDVVVAGYKIKKSEKTKNGSAQYWLEQKGKKNPNVITI